jgi:hypothetical protein
MEAKTMSGGDNSVRGHAYSQLQQPTTYYRWVRYTYR